MKRLRSLSCSLLVLALSGMSAGVAHAQTPVPAPYVPTVGQPGKDVVWVPSPDQIVNMMLDLAQVTSRDLVIDLGSGDGRNIIAAAKRGARGRGVEYNPDLVALSKRKAAEEGVADRATFVEGDMFAADISDATVFTLFLLPDNLAKLADKFLALKPGTRIVANTFGFAGWLPDETDELPDTECTDWCKVMLFVVPARVEGTWQIGQVGQVGQVELTLEQDFQDVSGTLVDGGRSTSITKGRLKGEEISFTAGAAQYTGRVNGERIEGTVTAAGQTTAWIATRSSPQAAPRQQGQFEPFSGQPGKDVVWVPTPPALVEKMLDLANVTPQDYVVDLGSGDGRNVIAAAKRGARALGVEYEPEMVELSRQIASREGVAGNATFVQGDMFATDFSDATVLALFLLPDNLQTLRPKFLALKPGTRIVANTFGIEEWDADRTETIEGDCGHWCTALLWIVPAQAGGTWRLPDGTLIIQQDFQKLYGTLRLGERETRIEQGRMRGDQFTFHADGSEYAGRLDGARLEGTKKSGANISKWTAIRVN